MGLFHTVMNWMDTDDIKTSAIRLIEVSSCLMFMIIGVTVVAQRLFEGIF